MVREYLNEHPLISAAVVLAAPLLVLFAIWHSASEHNNAMRYLTESWYTDDDGKTWYPDNKALTPPFDHKGKTSVRAYIFTCDEDKHEFVGYLERFTPEAKQAIEQSREEMKTVKEPPPAGLFERISTNGIEVKRPGESEWVNLRSPKAAAIRKVICPSGGNVQQIMP